MSLVFVVIGSCFILFALKVEFLALIFMLIYIGAIAILMLFIILILQLKEYKILYNMNFITNSTNLLYLIFICKVFFYFYYYNKLLSIAISIFSYEYLNTDFTHNAES